MAKSREQRLKENKGVKAGTIRKGRGTNKYNRWDPKTARWIPVAAARTGEGSGQKDTLKRGITRAKNTGGLTKKTEAAKKPTAAQQAVAANKGFVRGSGMGQRASAERLDNARAQNTTYAGRNAAAIAGLTIGAAVAGVGAGAAGASTAARAAMAARAAKAVQQGAKTGGARVGGVTRNTPRANKAASQAKVPEGATRTSPVGNPRLNGAGRTGPKTAAQAGVKKATPKKAPVKKAAPAVKKATPTRGQSAAGSRYAAQAKATPRKRK